MNITNNNAGWLTARVYGDTNGVRQQLGRRDIPVSGAYTLNFTAIGDSSYVVLTSSLDTGVSFTVNFASMAKYVTQQVNVPTAQVPIYPNYRFGFNAQEKVDEVAGIGNHYTALYWEYDPRDVKRWNLDPKPNPSFSSYAVFGNSPILNKDYLGDTTYTFNGTTGSYMGMTDLKEKGAKGKIDKIGGTQVSSYFEFADPVSDSKAIRDGDIKQLFFADDKMIYKEVMSATMKADVTNRGDLMGGLYLLNNSNSNKLGNSGTLSFLIKL